MLTQISQKCGTHQVGYTRQFSILDYLDKLTSLRHGKYECPACGGDNLSISKDGAYKCYSGCESKDIRSAIAPHPKRQTAYSGSRKPIPLPPKATSHPQIEELSIGWTTDDVENIRGIVRALRHSGHEALAVAYCLEHMPMVVCAAAGIRRSGVSNA